jgi:hypothetical protein
MTTEAFMIQAFERARSFELERGHLAYANDYLQARNRLLRTGDARRKDAQNTVVFIDEVAFMPEKTYWVLTSEDERSFMRWDGRMSAEYPMLFPSIPAARAFATRMGYKVYPIPTYLNQSKTELEGVWWKAHTPSMAFDTPQKAAMSFVAALVGVMLGVCLFDVVLSLWK